MDVLAEQIENIAELAEGVGDPKKILIEIRRADEFDEKLSPEEVVHQIDDEILRRNSVFSIDIMRVWKQGDHYLVLGAKI